MSPAVHIVLTGTVDNAMIEKRVEDYAKAVEFYQRFATVFFLENSKYRPGPE